MTPSRVASCLGLFLAALTARADAPAAEGFGWRALPDLPVGVVAPAASVRGDLLVVSGGVTLTGGTSDLVQVMDLAQRQWVRVFRLGEPHFSHAQVTLDDGRVLVVGGLRHEAAGRTSRITACELIDLDAQPPNEPVTPAPPLPIAMRALTLDKLADGRVVAIGEKIAVVYDPALDAWSEPIALTQPRAWHATVVTGPRTLLVIAGVGMQTFERIDADAMRSDYYRQPRLPFNLDDPAAHRLDDGRVWVIGGQQMNGQTIDRTWLVDVSPQGAPTAVRDGPSLQLPEGIADHVLVETRWGLVIAGGESEDAARHDKELAVALLLDTRTLAVSRLPDTPVAHDDAATVAWNGTIILLGGQTPGSVLGMTMPTPVSAVHMLEKEQRVEDGGQRAD